MAAENTVPNIKLRLINPSIGSVGSSLRSLNVVQIEGPTQLPPKTRKITQ
jgi:hypothetical protein